MTQELRKNGSATVKGPALEDLKRLISVGKEKGYLTYDELNEVLPKIWSLPKSSTT